MDVRRGAGRWLALPAIPAVLLLGPAPAVAAGVGQDGGHDHGTHIGPMAPMPMPMPTASHDMSQHMGHDMGSMPGHDSGTTGHDMGSMSDHGSGSTGHDSHGSSGGHEATTDHSEHGVSGTHGDTAPPADRPRTLVLGGFGALNGLVLATAAVLRRRGAADRRRRSRAARATAGDTTG